MYKTWDEINERIKLFEKWLEEAETEANTVKEPNYADDTSTT